MGNTYWTYILASRRNGTLYVGVTNSLQRCVWQHRNGDADSFTKRYAVNRLVYFESFRDITNAIAREIALIEQENVEWRDLSEGWFE